MRSPLDTQILRLLKEQRGNLKYDIAHAKAKIAGMEAELQRTEEAIDDLEQTERERLSDGD